MSMAGGSSHVADMGGVDGHEESDGFGGREKYRSLRCLRKSDECIAIHSGSERETDRMNAQLTFKGKNDEYI